MSDHAPRAALSAVLAILCLTAPASAQDLSAPRAAEYAAEGPGQAAAATLVTPPGVEQVFLSTINGMNADGRPVIQHRRFGAGLAGPTPDWHNNGGNSARNGQSSHNGPALEEILWNGGPASIISWQPFIEGQRVFVVRQTGFPPGGEPNGSLIYALDLDDGGELWRKNIPFEAGDWTTWIAGVNNGVVYASRSGNGATSHARLYALDAASGGTLWFSDDDIDAGPYDGVVFAPDGDPIIGNQQNLMRIDADGSTVWQKPRLCNVTSSCGPALFGDAVYVADAAVGGNAIVRHDLATGDALYASPVMIGFTLQNTPMVGPDGTIYLSRTQNNPITDFFYAFTDTGTALTEKWCVAAGWSTASEFAVGHDGSVYMMAPGNEIHRLDPATGDPVDMSAVIAADFLTPRLAADAAGRLYFSNGAFSNGRLYAFKEDLTPLWDAPVASANIGGPVLGAAGTLVQCGVGTDLRAWRSAPPPCAGVADCADGDDNGLRDDPCLWWACAAGTCQSTAIVFADVGGQFGDCAPDGAADGNDRFHALNCFSNQDTAGGTGYPCEAAPPGAFNVDAGGPFGSCSPDGVCDGNDAFHALNAFNATNSCSCSGGPAPASRLRR